MMWPTAGHQLEAVAVGRCRRGGLREMARAWTRRGEEGLVVAVIDDDDDASTPAWRWVAGTGTVPGTLPDRTLRPRM